MWVAGIAPDSNQGLYALVGAVGYMSVIETVSDVNNKFLSRRELTCNFAGLGGRLRKLDAIDMISKEFKLDGKTVIPVSMTSHVGKPLMTGTFYVYDDEDLAKRQVNPVILARLEKARKAAEEEEANAASADQGQEASTEGQKEENAQ